MKRALYITFIAVALCGSVATLLYSRAVHPHLLPPTGPLTYRDAQGYATQFEPSAPAVESIRSWVAAHQTGWHLSFVTYAQRSYFTCDTFAIEIGERRIVLNYARRRGSVFTELVRELAPDEQPFRRETVDAARKT